MAVFIWLSQYWFDVVQTVGIVGGLLFTTQMIHKDVIARSITNLLAVNEQYGKIWHEFYDNSKLSRILDNNLDLNKNPISAQEVLFVKTLLLHLDVVRRTIHAGIFVEIEGLQSDIQDFFALPIPKAVWLKLKQFQNREFVAFIDDCLRQ